MQKVIWSEGHPDKATCPGGLLAPFGRFAHALVWSMRGKRTRSFWPADDGSDAVTIAKQCEEQLSHKQPQWQKRFDAYILKDPTPDVAQMIADLDRYEKAHS